MINTLRMVRTFDAAPERVFAAWDRTRRNSCNGSARPAWSITVCEIDVRPGGAWRIAGLHDGTRQGLRLVGQVCRGQAAGAAGLHLGASRDGDFSARADTRRRCAIEFKALGERTELTLTQGPFRDRSSTDNHRWGWTGSFDKLRRDFPPDEEDSMTEPHPVVTREDG